VKVIISFERADGVSFTVQQATGPDLSPIYTITRREPEFFDLSEDPEDESYTWEVVSKLDANDARGIRDALTMLLGSGPQVLLP